MVLFPGGSEGKAFACNAGNPGSIPGLGRSPGEGSGSPLLETRVQSLGQEDLLEKEMVTHSSVLSWRSSQTEKPGRLQSMGQQRVGHD